MKNTKIILLVVILVFVLTFSWPKKELAAPEQETKIILLSHPQEVWLYALEWCESRGVITSVNPNDKDNTPSYYSHQFKPGTFKSFGEKYGLIEKGKTDEEIKLLMKDYDLTIKIMQQMILDKDITAHEWRYSLFPGCIKKLGLPPTK